MPEDFRPALTQLGALMRARTRDDEGKELGTFTTATRPTAAEANALVDEALGLTTPRLGTVPAKAVSLARSLVALRAAMLVELAYWPEESGGEDSSYGRYREQYADGLRDYDEVAADGVGADRVYAASERVHTIYTATP